MKIKIIDIHSENGQRDMGFCETCEYWETYDITSVEIQEVGTDNVATVEFDNDNDDLIADFKFADWIKFADYLASHEVDDNSDLGAGFTMLLMIFYKERSDAK